MTSAPKIGITAYATPTDTQAVITRVVNASRQLAFDVYTKPEHIRRWMLGPDGWTMPICDMDARAGGAWRYVWRKSDGAEMTMTGTVREFTPPERVVTTESWGPEWPETLNEVAFTEMGGRTTITTTITYPSKEARDAALKTGMKEGVDKSFDRMDRLFEALVPA